MRRLSFSSFLSLPALRVLHRFFRQAVADALDSLAPPDTSPVDSLWQLVTERGTQHSKAEVRYQVYGEKLATERAARRRVEEFHTPPRAELERALGRAFVREDAEEIVADALLDALLYWTRAVRRRRRTWRSISEVDCQRMARWVLACRRDDFLRDHLRRREFPGDEPVGEDFLVAEDDVFTQVAAKLDQDGLLRLIANEPENRQWPLQRIVLLGDSRAQVARDLGVDRATVGRWMQDFGARVLVEVRRERGGTAG